MRDGDRYDPNYEYVEGEKHGDKTMTGGLTEEIEKATNIKYAKNALLSTYSSLEQLMKLGNHLQLVENFKQNPDFLEHTIPAKSASVMGFNSCCSATRLVVGIQNLSFAVPHAPVGPCR